MQDKEIPKIPLRFLACVMRRRVVLSSKTENTERGPHVALGGEPGAGRGIRVWGLLICL